MQEIYDVQTCLAARIHLTSQVRSILVFSDQQQRGPQRLQRAEHNQNYVYKSVK